MRMTASYRKASGCIQPRNRQQERRRSFWHLGAHSDETAKKRSEVAVARRPPMVSAPGKRMGCCCFGASPLMRIVASWFGSNGSTVYKEVAVGFFTTIVNLKRAPPRVALLSLSQVIGRRRLTRGGRSASADHHQSPIRMARKKEAP